MAKSSIYTASVASYLKVTCYAHFQVSTRKGLHPSMFTKHIIFLIAAVPLIRGRPPVWSMFQDSTVHVHVDDVHEDF